MSHASPDEDVTERLVIARVGWCNAYNGDVADPPRNGGEFNSRGVGSEHQNFQQFGGKFYGYARPRGRLNLPRMVGGADVTTEDDSAEDVCVALIATSGDLGQVLVGWYRHAEMYADMQDHRKRGYYHWTSKASDGHLLLLEQRTLVVPKGKNATGQANITYARDPDGSLQKRPYLKAIRKAILKPALARAIDIAVPSNEDAIVRGQGFQQDVLYRTEIEQYSMKKVRKELLKRYETVKDVSKEQSYDYLCISADNKQHKIEVKGTTTPGDSVLVSRLEFELANAESVDLYVLSEIDVIENDDETNLKGGRLTVYKNWSRCALDNKATGYKITLRR